MCEGGGVGCPVVFARLRWLRVIPVIGVVVPPVLVSSWLPFPPVAVVVPPSLSRCLRGAIEKAASTRNPPCEQWLAVAGAGAGLSFRWWALSILVGH